MTDLHTALQEARALALALQERAERMPGGRRSARQTRVAEAQRLLAALEVIAAHTGNEATPPNAAGDHPFHAGFYPTDAGPRPLYHLSAEDRLRVVPQLDAAQCRRALALPGLQLTVQRALERRLRQLAREGAA
ncbi:MAG: hypothetical protein K6T33_09250 [Thermomonas hydrothermalis]|uniref:hypothetical protein n=1 Tax=Thermomonas hydrothermalis TaxID=213588 RepID=UPI002352C3FC|nr:hypothetical protein [Thermomonas hydrothermalis]MCL6619960.1 hypothetical protein [Thermomonas hydrothermalis]